MTDNESSGQVPIVNPDNDLLKRLDTIIQQNRAIEERLRTSGDTKRLHVKIADADMPFFSLVGLLVKIALASIPAMVIVWAILLGLIVLAVLIGQAFGISGEAPISYTAPRPSMLTDITTPTYSFITTAAVAKSPAPKATVQPTPRIGPIEMFEVTSRVADGSYIVEGQVVNKGSTEITDAFVVVVFYGEAGQQEARAKLNNLPLQPDDVSSFRVSSPMADVGDFSVDFVSSLGKPIPFYDTAP